MRCEDGLKIQLDPLKMYTESKPVAYTSKVIDEYTFYDLDDPELHKLIDNGVFVHTARRYIGDINGVRVERIILLVERKRKYTVFTIYNPNSGLYKLSRIPNNELRKPV